MFKTFNNTFNNVFLNSVLTVLEYLKNNGQFMINFVQKLLRKLVQIRVQFFRSILWVHYDRHPNQHHFLIPPAYLTGGGGNNRIIFDGVCCPRFETPIHISKSFYGFFSLKKTADWVFSSKFRKSGPISKEFSTPKRLICPDLIF